MILLGIYAIYKVGKCVKRRRERRKAEKDDVESEKFKTIKGEMVQMHSEKKSIFKASETKEPLPPYKADDSQETEKQ